MRFAISFFDKYFPVQLLFVLFLFNLPIGAAVSQAAEQKQAGQPPMSFILVRRAVCNQPCPEWISAEGRITSDTPAQMRKILKKIGNRKLPVVFRSEGGDVNAAYAMGRMIRKAGLETAVGGTRLEGCPPEDLRCAAAIARNGASAGSTYSYGAYCVSACPLALAGGTTRASSQWAYIGVHQITTVYNKMRVSYRIEYKMVNGKRQEVSRKEIGRKVTGQSSSTKLGKKATATLKAYLKEMDVSDDIVDLMMSAGPESMAMVVPTEALRTGLITDMLAYNEWPGMPLCAKDAAPEAVCYRHPTTEATVSQAPPVQDVAAYTYQGASKTHPMDFLVMYNGNCVEECTQWISADGDITRDTPAQLDAILKTLGGRKLPVVFQSFGGDMEAAFAMGRMIRAAGLETSVGGARLPNCPVSDPRCTASMAKGGPTEGEVSASGAYCFSSCTLAFMGGTPRLVGSSDMGLNQPAAKLTEAERDKFHAYFNEMGISLETVDTMMTAPPSARGLIYHSQALKLGIINGVIPDDEEPGFHLCGPNAKESVRCPRKSEAAIVPADASVN